jgi:hypothetical protein
MRLETSYGSKKERMVSQRPNLVSEALVCLLLAPVAAVRTQLGARRLGQPLQTTVDASRGLFQHMLHALAEEHHGLIGEREHFDEEREPMRRQAQHLKEVDLRQGHQKDSNTHFDQENHTTQVSVSQLHSIYTWIVSSSRKHSSKNSECHRCRKGDTTLVTKKWRSDLVSSSGIDDCTKMLLDL